MTEEEWLALDKKVTEMGIPKGTYLRNLASRILLKPVPDEKLIEILKQMRHIGNNINQATRRMNASSVPMQRDAEILKKEMREIWLLLKSIESTLR